MFFESRFASEIYQGVGMIWPWVSVPEMVVMSTPTAELLSWLITIPSETVGIVITSD